MAKSTDKKPVSVKQQAHRDKFKACAAAVKAGKYENVKAAWAAMYAKKK